MIGQKGLPARAGGIERHVEELSLELTKKGHEVVVFCRSWYSWPIGHYKGIRCVKSGSIPTKHLDAITHTFTSIVKAAKEKVDVFHIHGVGPALLSWLPRLLRPSAKVVVTFHCIDRQHQKWGVIARTALFLGEWIACRVPHVVIVVSKTLQSYCKQRYGIDPIYLPNGTRTPSTISDPSLLASFDLTPNTYLLMCARLVPHKGAHTLIEAWKQLQKTHAHLLFGKKLVIVGGSAFTDAYAASLKTLAEHDDSIVLTGAQYGETLHALFASSYALVHPSTSEGLPITILEAMSHGKCVLSSDIPENLELTLYHGKSFATGKTQDLAEGLAYLLEHPEEIAAIGAEAKQHVADIYNWNDIGEAVSALYDAMHKQKATRLATA